MPLTAPQNKRLRELTIDAFKVDGLRMLLSDEMDLVLGNLVNVAQPDTVVVFDLCEILTKRGLIRKFIDVVIKALPDRVDIQTEFPEMLKTLDSQTGSTAQVTEELDQDLQKVQTLLDNPAVSAEAQKAKGFLTELADTIARLKAYKDLHDKLHTLQGDTSSLEQAVAEMNEDLQDSVAIIRATVVECEPIAARLPALVRPMETSWLTALKGSATRLEQARTHHSAPAATDAERTTARNKAADALMKIRSVLMGEPSRIDGFIRETAGGLKLEGLSGLFQAVAQASSPQDKVQQGMAAAELNAKTVEELLKSRVKRHFGWQTVMRDITLTMETLASIISTVVPPGADESEIFTDKDEPLATAKAIFDGTWKDMVGRVTELQALAPDALRMKIVADAVSASATAREREDWRKAAKAATSFSRTCVEEFLRTDAELKLTAEDVAKVGDSINQILNLLKPQ